MDEAVHFGHHDVVTILRDYHTQYSPQEPTTTDKQSAEKNLDGMLWQENAWRERFLCKKSLKSSWTGFSEGRNIHT